ncbi:hypothetical protein [Acinetobacter baumannii]|uniref:hypothetical protein n=1 Tax=Acinetobacter baumannii TaxID=470 RepID=UPI0013B9EBF3|nr:hypothetical protein [Acinetobacter baumannii]NDX17998.1 hypothetical protein [Acinetobacter baumannii]NDX37698.1 hypothetical protein [Acinetobacter baumannii]
MVSKVALSRAVVLEELIVVYAIIAEAKNTKSCANTNQSATFHSWSLKNTIKLSDIVYKPIKKAANAKNSVSPLFVESLNNGLAIPTFSHDIHLQNLNSLIIFLEKMK